MNRKSQNFDVIAHSEFSKYAAWVVAQAKHESANFTSRVYRLNNNPFGMKVPHLRGFLGTQGTKASDGGYYAAYPNDTVAFKDFIKWLRAVRFPTDLETVEDYVLTLKRKSYFGDTVKNYLAGLKRWL